MSRSFEADVVRSVTFSAISDSYANLGSALTKPIQILSFKNTTDATVFISENWSDDHYELIAGTTEVYDFQANAQPDGQGAKAAGTQFTVRGITGGLPTSGKVIIQGQYT